MAYTKQTWDTNSDFTPTRMNHIEDGIYNTDLTKGGNISGNINVIRSNSTSTTNDSRIYVGNNIPDGTTGSTRGLLTLYDKNQYAATIVAGNDSLTANRTVKIPNVTGWFAVSPDNFMVEFGRYTLTIQGDSTQVTGIKLTDTSNNRYLIMGSVITGSTNAGCCVIYNSWQNSYVVLPPNVQP